MTFLFAGHFHLKKIVILNIINFFKGEFIPWEEYKKREDNGTESGYAWIIKDPKLKNTIGKKYF
jgi:hypothetical protein